MCVWGGGGGVHLVPIASYVTSEDIETQERREEGVGGGGIREKTRSGGGRWSRALMVSVDVRHHVYLLTGLSQGAGLSFAFQVSTVALRTLALWLCSAQLLKEQSAKYTSRFAMAGSPAL